MQERLLMSLLARSTSPMHQEDKEFSTHLPGVTPPGPGPGPVLPVLFVLLFSASVIGFFYYYFFPIPCSSRFFYKSGNFQKAQEKASA